ncbi:uncharacterized protein LOC114966232 [Acropora millepora]|uniref:uncharacterized protein LOC114966232 n=1 Tax=Acropora millepora TaxID=45264 RepID=UPI001CF43FB9|nr:uncharacterized protein LOC114966232 [Acropora millepora]
MFCADNLWNKYKGNRTREKEGEETLSPLLPWPKWQLLTWLTLKSLVKMLNNRCRTSGQETPSTRIAVLKNGEESPSGTIILDVAVRSLISGRTANFKQRVT